MDAFICQTIVSWWCRLCQLIIVLKWTDNAMCELRFEMVILWCLVQWANDLCFMCIVSRQLEKKWKIYILINGCEFSVKIFEKWRWGSEIISKATVKNCHAFQTFYIQIILVLKGRCENFIFRCLKTLLPDSISCLLSKISGHENIVLKQTTNKKKCSHYLLTLMPMGSLCEVFKSTKLCWSVTGKRHCSHLPNNCSEWWPIFKKTNKQTKNIWEFRGDHIWYLSISGSALTVLPKWCFLHLILRRLICSSHLC